MKDKKINKIIHRFVRKSKENAIERNKSYVGDRLKTRAADAQNKIE